VCLDRDSPLIPIAVPVLIIPFLKCNLKRAGTVSKKDIEKIHPLNLKEGG
jgi:hypothetical protein